MILGLFHILVQLGTRICSYTYYTTETLRAVQGYVSRDSLQRNSVSWYDGLGLNSYPTSYRESDILKVRNVRLKE